MADNLIRGMEMPQNCRNCEFGVLVDTTYMIEYKCYILKQTVFDDSKRLKDCPLQELPEHGDLIDRDVLKHKFCAHCDGYENDTGACVDGDQDCMDAKIIMTAPVIVPSNKEEKELDEDA